MSIYFIQGVEGGPIKIGYSRNPSQRLAALQTTSPVPLEILFECPGDRRCEQILHAEFAEGRLYGEWFSEDTPDLAEFLEFLIAPDLSDPEIAWWFGRLREYEADKARA